jgi:selenide,water dikinase
MGAEPKIALNIAAWPVDDLPLELLADVLRGGLEVATRAGVALLGGHTITDPEPKYGMVALGFADPAKLVRNSTARAGDGLVLTKPIGTGMISTAVKRRVATDEQVRAAVDTMTALNADAAEAMRRVDVSAGTDVTGFGLLGHLRKMLEASGVSADVEAGAVPLLPGVLDLARSDVVASGTKRNLAWLNATTDWGGLTEPERIVLADAQTSGGLLIATPDPAALVAELDVTGVQHAVIGSVRGGEPGRIRVHGRVEGSAGD